MLDQSSSQGDPAEAQPRVQGGEDVVTHLELPIPMKRSQLKLLKAVKYNQGELEKLAKFQEYLATTVNPFSGQPFIPQNTYAALVHFCVNYTFQQMARLAQEMARAEADL